MNRGITSLVAILAVTAFVTVAGVSYYVYSNSVELFSLNQSQLDQLKNQELVLEDAPLPNYSSGCGTYLTADVLDKAMIIDYPRASIDFSSLKSMTESVGVPAAYTYEEGDCWAHYDDTNSYDYSDSRGRSYDVKFGTLFGYNMYKRIYGIWYSFLKSAPGFLKPLLGPFKTYMGTIDTDVNYRYNNDISNGAKDVQGVGDKAWWYATCNSIDTERCADPNAYSIRNSVALQFVKDHLLYSVNVEGVFNKRDGHSISLEGELAEAIIIAKSIIPKLPKFGDISTCGSNSIFPTTKADASDIMGNAGKSQNVGQMKRLLPGTKVFHTNRPQDYFSQLKPGEVLLHIPSQDSATGDPAFAIDTQEHAFLFDKTISDRGIFKYSAQGTLSKLNTDDPNLATKVEQTFANFNKHVDAHTDEIADLTSTFEQSGDLYQSSGNLMDYVDQLPPNTNGQNVEDIYNHVQENLPENNSIASDYSTEKSMSCGIGVCRNGATYLAEALVANGVDASIVFDQNHAWVRVNDDGSGSGPYDLDPNAYQSFMKAPVRAVEPFQIIKVGNSSSLGNQSRNYTSSTSSSTCPVLNFNFLKKLFTPATANAQTISSTMNQQNLCFAIGTCVAFNTQVYVTKNTSTSAIFWQMNGDVWSMVSLKLSPSVVFKPSGTSTPTSSKNILLFDQIRPAVEYTHDISGWETIHDMYTSYVSPDGTPIVVGVVSNGPILSSSNKDLLKTLSGWGVGSKEY